MAYAFNELGRRGSEIPDPVADSDHIANSEEFALLKQEIEKLKAVLDSGRLETEFMDKLTIKEIRMIEKIDPWVPAQMDAIEPGNAPGTTISKIRVSYYETFLNNPDGLCFGLAWEVRRGYQGQWNMRAAQGRADARNFAKEAARVRRDIFGD